MNSQMPKKTRGRGRPSRTPKQIEECRQLIVASAKQLFLSEGYQGVTMRKIAAKADCLPATLYAIFPNKRAILYHLWDTIFVKLFDYLFSIYQKSTQENRLYNLCVGFVDFWFEHPEDYVAIFTIDDRIPTQNEDNFVINFNITQRFDVFINAIIEAQELGQIAAGDPEEIQNILLCCVQGITFNLITIPEYPWGDTRRLKTQTIEIVLKGLKTY
ncbi:TetR/AcrR family transcriptional regulator [Acinetobacter nosocomialis]|uniref:TetR/AcrR family transcriptional regulator n=2 Tax=Acinetobacter calcoaceticus/baumannii complex TaxID=909768 RepID=UPI00244845FD|nr:TetR/AcrR family transcriptional regulator [Acinetobacter nosocomialis]MDH2634309.1 TetR/AcrR family transcriptional regulator [Acinetobacter nosocomialis]